MFAILYIRKVLKNVLRDSTFHFQCYCSSDGHMLLSIEIKFCIKTLIKDDAC